MMNGFNANVPIYIQVVEDMKMKIMNGTLKPGDKIASVREIAVDLGVNPNTIQRAFAELEREGFIRTERAVGRYVADNPQLIKDYKKKEVKKKIDDFLAQMQLLGMDYEDVLQYLQKYKEED